MTAGADKWRHLEEAYAELQKDIQWKVPPPPLPLYAELQKDIQWKVRPPPSGELHKEIQWRAAFERAGLGLIWGATDRQAALAVRCSCAG